ncbi:MAG TPA: hypothetical protein VN153_12005 [Tahibacter sp.]|nr:hypothetical protein [Tahibacter sp.]
MTTISRMKSALLFLALALLAQAVCAEPTDPLGKWFCASLKNFDPDSAFSTFPLQKLGKPVETRKKRDRSTAVRLRAEGQDVAVEYSYQFKEDDVDGKYGFELTVEDEDGDVIDERRAMRWLMEFGKPQKGMFGWQVANAKDDTMPNFSFDMDDTTYVSVSMSWFHEKDIARGGPLCEAAKAPPANARLPNDPAQGPAADPRTDPLSVWYCSVLRKGFDFSAALKSFPLESLTQEVTEHRESDDGIVSVERNVEGDAYKVAYRYSYHTKDVDAPYGFGLYIYDVGRSGYSDYEGRMKWLRGFGTPKKDPLGHSVAAVPPDIQGLSAPFSFALWSTGVRSAQWFHDSDIALASKLCPR